jgi:outer membrane lipoprotein-sorting protein
MKRVLLILLALLSLSAMAEERGVKRLEKISNHYSTLGDYSVTFLLRAGGGEQRGVMLVRGNNSYFKVANTEIFIDNALRYEVNSATKEIVVDKADVYEKELLNSLNGISRLAADYTVEECEIEGRAAVRLTPKKGGEVISIVTGADGASVAKLRYGAGENLVEVNIEKSEKYTQPLPRFSKERYKGFEMVDFR